MWVSWVDEFGGVGCWGEQLPDGRLAIHGFGDGSGAPDEFPFPPDWSINTPDVHATAEEAEAAAARLSAALGWA